VTAGSARRPLPRALDELPTPALLLDLDRLEANLASMAGRAAALGVTLRPHIKTHKCVEVARRQRELGAAGLTVSTLEEARAFAAAGFDDLTWAFPVILGRLGEVRRLAERVRLGVVVDSEAAAAALEREGPRFRVFLKVDCGYGRAGVDPEAPEATALARRLAASPRLDFAGLLTHSGHAYHVRDRDGARRVAEQERRAVVGFAEALRADGIDVPEVSAGSTPAMAAVERLDGVTEARPGNYALYDGSQVALGTCTAADCALTVLASVVSRRSGHAVIDAGALALSKDPGPLHLGDAWRSGMGAVFEDEGAYRAGRPSERLHLSGLSQEHGTVSAPLQVGARVRVLPNHSCLAVPCFEACWVVRGEEVVGRWKIHRERT
jgi:D-serine deaminase-like pyridoxal phosphate-dependent protein